MLVRIATTVKAFCFFSALVLLLVVASLMRWDQLLDWSAGRVRYDASTTGFLLNLPGCVIPDVDPFDPSVVRLFSSKRPLMCKGLPALVGVDYRRATLWLDERVASSYYRVVASSLNCSYRAIKRDPESRSDSKILVEERGRPLTVDATPIADEFVYVQCRNHWGKEIYSDYVPFIQKKPKVERRASRAKKMKKAASLSVVLLGIDSVSRLNFVRHFPLTRRLLSEEMNALQLLGYTKVGDNTFPNMIPMLMGRHAAQLWNETDLQKPFDDLPLVWKNFSVRGYRTFYAEEIPTISAFNYLKSGFHRQPTDYYYRPFTLATEGSFMRRKSSDNCFNRRMEVEVVLNWLRDYLSTFAGEPSFSLTFVSRLTHDNLNAAGWADRPYHDFLKGAYDGGLFNRSVLFFFSDHGIRFGAIRDTYIGKLEERLPFFFAVFPKWFPSKFPILWKNLSLNQRRLTTPFDIYATMLDAMRFDGSQDGLPDAKDDRAEGPGLSLFRPVPATRTCADASILPHWCVCHDKKMGNLSSESVRTAALALVKEINLKLASVRHACAILSLKQLVDVRVSSLNENVLDFKSGTPSFIGFGPRLNPVFDYLLTLRVSPSDGLFEGTVRYQEAAKVYTVMNPISRISFYGNQSSCVNSTEMRLFCYCLFT